MSLRFFVLTALLAMSRPVLGSGSGEEQPAKDPVLGTDTVHGCYSSIGSLTFNQTDNFNSQGSCAQACRNLGAYVGATSASDCYCGSKYPPLDALVDDSKCTEPCPGFGSQACGGLDTYTVYNTGVKVTVASEKNATSSSTTGAGASSTSAQTVVTVVGSDGVATTSAAASESSSSGGTNTVGVAVGAVVGVVGAAGLAGAVFFFMRRSRNQEIEDEHRRNAAVNSFIGGKPPSLSDQRLDPVMAQRRMSSGSIADNQDYSRRILRVTNA